MSTWQARPLAASFYGNSRTTWRRLQLSPEPNRQCPPGWLAHRLLATRSSTLVLECAGMPTDCTASRCRIAHTPVIYRQGRPETYPPPKVECTLLYEVDCPLTVAVSFTIFHYLVWNLSRWLLLPTVVVFVHSCWSSLTRDVIACRPIHLLWKMRLLHM